MTKFGKYLGQIALVALVVVAILFAYDRFFRPSPGDPLATTISALKKENKLVVFSAQVVPVVSSTDSRVLGLLQSQQTAIIPGYVEYYLDMSQLDENSIEWDAETQKLSITLPPLMISPPNLSENRAQYYRKGLLITGEAQEALFRGNSAAALAEATEQARKPLLVNMAKKAAKEAIHQNMTVPLRSAGFDNITTTIRFANEG